MDLLYTVARSSMIWVDEWGVGGDGVGCKRVELEVERSIEVDGIEVDKTDVCVHVVSRKSNILREGQYLR